MKIEEYKDENSEHRIRLTADNGNIMYASTEGYKNKEDAVQAAIITSIELLKMYREDISVMDWFTILNLTEGEE